MITRPGLRAVLVHQPWLDHYELHIGGYGAGAFVAEGVENGRIRYKQVEDAVLTEPFLKLDQSEIEALAKALLAEARPEDATLDALKDARSVRDRLLALVEKRGPR